GLTVISPAAVGLTVISPANENKTVATSGVISPVLSMSIPAGIASQSMSVSAETAMSIPAGIAAKSQIVPAGTTEFIPSGTPNSPTAQGSKHSDTQSNVSSIPSNFSKAGSDSFDPIQQYLSSISLSDVNHCLAKCSPDIAKVFLFVFGQIQTQSNGLNKCLSHILKSDFDFVKEVCSSLQKNISDLSVKIDAFQQEQESLKQSVNELEDFQTKQNPPLVSNFSNKFDKFEKKMQEQFNKKLKFFNFEFYSQCSKNDSVIQRLDELKSDVSDRLCKLESFEKDLKDKIETFESNLHNISVNKNDSVCSSVDSVSDSGISESNIICIPNSKQKPIVSNCRNKSGVSQSSKIPKKHQPRQATFSMRIFSFSSGPCSPNPTVHDSFDCGKPTVTSILQNN
ncbi:MAG: hypothetical protein GY795_29270, partial [Desulfobacterales bacterium]|nr:hypothetical protein [Desulfobacterales bacterium]